MRTRVYQIVGRSAQCVEFPDGDDKNLPAKTYFRASPHNAGVQRLLRQKPPTARAVPASQIPDELLNDPAKMFLIVG